MGCGCGGRKQDGRPMIQKSVIPTKTVQAIQVRRCPKCSWPMNSMRRYIPKTNTQVQIYSCLNKNCKYKEEK